MILWDYLGFAHHLHTLQPSERPGAGHIQSKVSAAEHDERSDEGGRSFRFWESISEVLLLLWPICVGDADPVLPLLQGAVLLQALQTEGMGCDTQERVLQGESWNTGLWYCSLKLRL